MALTQKEIEQYYREQGTAAAPLSPLQFEAKLRGTAPAPTITPPTIGPAPTTEAQRQATFTAAGLTPAEQANVTAGVSSPLKIADFTAGVPGTVIDATTERLGTEAKSEAEKQIDRDKTRADILARQQLQIDAINSAYSEMLSEARRTGRARLGGVTAAAARAGIVGSTPGQAFEEGALERNLEIERSIGSERLGRIADVYDKVETETTAELERQRKAKEAGAEAYLKYTQGQAERKEKITSSIVERFLARGLDPRTLTSDQKTELATRLGVPIDDIYARYDSEARKTARQKQILTLVGQGKTAEEVALETGIDIETVREVVKTADPKKFLEVSEGASLFDPVTGKLIGTAPKTFAPKAGSTFTPFQQFSATQSIAKDNQRRTENAREISRQVSLMQQAYNGFVGGGDKNVASQAIISTFNKILDPTSVVRESEYDRTAAGQAAIARIQGAYENIAQGGAGVTKATLKGAVDLATQYLKNAQLSLADENKRAEALATQFGLNPAFVRSVTPPAAPGVEEGEEAPVGSEEDPLGLFTE